MAEQIAGIALKVSDRRLVLQGASRDLLEAQDGHGMASSYL